MENKLFDALFNFFIIILVLLSFKLIGRYPPIEPAERFYYIKQDKQKRDYATNLKWKRDIYVSLSYSAELIKTNYSNCKRTGKTATCRTIYVVKDEKGKYQTIKTTLNITKTDDGEWKLPSEINKYSIYNLP